jgi:hypothetical protein
MQVSVELQLCPSRRTFSFGGARNISFEKKLVARSGSEAIARRLRTAHRTIVLLRPSSFHPLQIAISFGGSAFAFGGDPSTFDGGKGPSIVHFCRYLTSSYFDFFTG